MKKLIMFGVCNALLLSMSIGTPILSSRSFKQKQAEPIKNIRVCDSKNNICKGYSDADHDSICDNCHNISHNKNHHTTNKKTNTCRVTSPKSHHSENHNHNNHHR
ncbi:MAG: hypothetical protein K2N51_20420 [Lachnospiraceae bacterium]|nr:hypothetical protein [Lachnospiraceae bacterium]